MLILWPLVAAAALSIVWQLFYREPESHERRDREPCVRSLGSRSSVLLALYYTLFGAIVAFGVGKVGAYANYFLEFYAGLIWLAASAIE